ncbi:conserved Plasmodium protein, unknown function [Plasmodium berghei]|uniref:mTERF domain-containing protein, putative n=2 Tax=Plasmodium berghei TaxID=5821 RepID=A0A509AEG9_PLABA|nr:mTERF domain-containing protein, putative [Plasmodium berghei ANKA]CXH89329.1 conserved Plasmodium protein, unknown function [Plasmodium berghei]SCL90320.1 conserved Plasmodium protein, unknown function [Plasmodium berghei]SCM15267.1 conserved Plasmodium protein, unknown function [Plasmodium berghei]SCM17062.1 conserved Plasmodium protein, unknown function [Plasmodium berghei]SCN21956.1 conserved Plasmodium protein, unknown function [Plasmodium berghei]|eukprot:XP_034419842.1 mTERF domain-containing protein, putative [Plasmodium berghei ANKA]
MNNHYYCLLCFVIICFNSLVCNIIICKTIYNRNSSKESKSVLLKMRKNNPLKLKTMQKTNNTNKHNVKNSNLYYLGTNMFITSAYKPIKLHHNIYKNRSDHDKKVKKNIKWKYKILKATDKQVNNLKEIKNIDNTILGSNFHDKEDEIIDQIPEKFLNVFKWALEFKLKNFNCKFSRITKLAKKNNEQLKPLSNYAIGHKENLLAMLQNDKNFFVNIVKRLKSKDYFNFDIYSIFKFINIDIRFLFTPDCHDQSALFFLILGNIDKSINYFIDNRHTVNFDKMPKDYNYATQENGKSNMTIMEKKKLLRMQKKLIKEEKKRLYNQRLSLSEQNPNPSEENITKDGVTKDEVTKDGVTKDEVTKDEVTKDGVTKDEVTKDGVTKDEVTKDGVTKDEVTKDGVEKDGVTKDGVTKDGVEKYEVTNDGVENVNIAKTSSIDDKLSFFLKYYKELEYFFTNHFKSGDEIKEFFEKCNKKENKIIKEEINFHSNGEKIINKKEIIKNGLNLEMIKKVIKTSPRLSLINKRTLTKRIEHYRNEMNYNYNELMDILYNLPQFYSFGNLKKKYKELLYLHQSIKEDDLKKLIKIYPRIFTYNIYRTIRPKLLYLIRHLNKSFTDSISFPQYYSYSFRLRIIPRHVAYMNLYYVDYIKYYKELLRKYNYADFNNNFNSLVYNSNIPPINLKKLLQTSNKEFIEYYKIPYYQFIRSTQLAKHIQNPFIIY